MKLTLPEKLKPYSGVINFMIILLVSHFFWKYTVLGEDDDEIVRFRVNNIILVLCKCDVKFLFNNKRFYLSLSANLFVNMFLLILCIPKL